MATNALNLNQALSSGGLIPLGGAKPSTSLGVQAKAPVVATPANKLPNNQVKTSGSNANVLAQQKSLNAQGAGLKEDGIMGPLTQAAIAKYSSQTKTPDDASNKYNTATGQLNTKYSGYTAPQNTPAQPTYSQNDSGLYGKLIADMANKSTVNPTSGIVEGLQSGDYQKRIQDAIDAQNRAVNINQDLNQAINNQTKEAIPIQFQQGRQGAIQRDYGVQASAANQAASNAANIAGITQSGLSAAGGLSTNQQGISQSQLQSSINGSAPQFGVSYGTGVANPVTGQLNSSGGNYGTGVEAASNVQSVKDYQTQINNLNATAPAADAAFSILNSYASAVGGGNTPVLQGLSQLYGNTVQGSQAVAGFKAQLQAVRQAWTSIEGGDAMQAIPDNVTAAQLTQIQQQLKNDVKNKINNLTSAKNNLNGTSSGGSTGGNMFGSFF